MSAKLAKMSSLQRENLLINSDFKSFIINQKGELSYSMSGYLIDMWRSINANGKLTVNNGSITLTTSNQYSAQFMQPVYHDLLNETVTIAIKTKAISGTVILNLLGTNKTLQTGLNVFTYKITQNVQVGNGFQYFYFSMGSGNAVEIEFIKLERGSCFTGMPEYNVADELLKCKNYYIYGNLNGYGFYNNNFINITFPLFVPLYKKPSLLSVKNMAIIINGQIFYSSNAEASDINLNENGIQAIFYFKSSLPNFSTAYAEIAGASIDCYDY